MRPLAFPGSKDSVVGLVGVARAVPMPVRSTLRVGITRRLSSMCILFYLDRNYCTPGFSLLMPSVGYWPGSAASA